MKVLSLIFALVLLAAADARAGEARIAVAANFAPAAKEIAHVFEETSGHRVVFSFGSTGVLYAQIVQGAPFEAFLAADRARPQRLIEDGLALAESRFTYAIGRLVLFSRYENLVNGAETLKRAKFAKLAIANPETAPYGAAAVEAMKALEVHAALERRIVRGTSIAQAYQFVATGNAELGFVALSQVVGHARGSRWPVSAALHAPIAQDAVLLTGLDDAAPARAFLAFLKGPAARAVLHRHGYGTP